MGVQECCDAWSTDLVGGRKGIKGSSSCFEMIISQDFSNCSVINGNRVLCVVFTKGKKNIRQTAAKAVSDSMVRKLISLFKRDKLLRNRFCNLI